MKARARGDRCVASQVLPSTMRALPVARSIFDAPYVREANERPTTSWIIICHSKLEANRNLCDLERKGNP